MMITERDTTGDAVENTDAEQYRKEWAAKTGRPESDVYVPRALREPDDE